MTTEQLTDVEDGEQVKVTQRMALNAMADYAKAHVQERDAKKTKEALSKAIGPKYKQLHKLSPNTWCILMSLIGSLIGFFKNLINMLCA